MGFVFFDFSSMSFYYSIFFYLLQDAREKFTMLEKALIFDAEYAIIY